MSDKRIEREQRMYDALRRIAKGYKTPDQLRRHAEKEYGLEYEEALEYAYANIQSEAAAAIQGMRRPVQRTTAREGDHD